MIHTYTHTHTHTHNRILLRLTKEIRSSTTTQMDPEIITLEEAKSEKTNIV